MTVNVVFCYCYYKNCCCDLVTEKWKEGRAKDISLDSDDHGVYTWLSWVRGSLSEQLGAIYPSDKLNGSFVNWSICGRRDTCTSAEFHMYMQRFDPL